MTSLDELALADFVRHPVWCRYKEDYQALSSDVRLNDDDIVMEV